VDAHRAIVEGRRSAARFPHLLASSSMWGASNDRRRWRTRSGGERRVADDDDDDDDESRRPPPAAPIVFAVAHRLADDDGDRAALLVAIISRICAISLESCRHTHAPKNKGIFVRPERNPLQKWRVEKEDPSRHPQPRIPAQTNSVSCSAATAVQIFFQDSLFRATAVGLHRNLLRSAEIASSLFDQSTP